MITFLDFYTKIKDGYTKRGLIFKVRLGNNKGVGEQSPKIIKKRIEHKGLCEGVGEEGKR